MCGHVFVAVAVLLLVFFSLMGERIAYVAVFVVIVVAVVVCFRL